MTTSVGHTAFLVWSSMCLDPEIAFLSAPKAPAADLIRRSTSRVSVSVGSRPEPRYWRSELRSKPQKLYPITNRMKAELELFPAVPRSRVLLAVVKSCGI